MKILFISPSFPTRLHRIRAWQLITELAKRHEVHLITLAFSSPPTKELTDLRRICASVIVVRKSYLRGLLDALWGLCTLKPLEIAFCHSAEMEKSVARITQEEKIDVVYIKRLRSAQFVTIDIPTILDSTDAMSLFYDRARRAPDIFRKPFHSLEYFAYKHYELLLAKKFRHWVVCSPTDAAYLQKQLSPGVTVSVIPNGVDTEYYEQTNEKPEANTILITGLFTKFVNIEAARYFVSHIFPIIESRLSEVKLLLVGPAGWEVRSLAKPNVVVTGEVPDIRPYLVRASVVCVPVLTGTGTRNKILQAWALGRPVVSTSQGAEGLTATEGQNILIGMGPREFADQVMEILTNPDLAGALVAQGTKVINNVYSMEIIGHSVDALLLRVRNV